MDIMTDLVRISGLFLISEISMFSYKSQAPSVRELGRQLGVSHVLDGGVRKEGDRIRITTRLLETNTAIQRSENTGTGNEYASEGRIALEKLQKK
jgi:TolB-like protein